ncbi:MAG: protein kinase [Planctomycetes bacterium]|nr:protein kinase [Planctomycetota bacterium]
MAQPLDDETLLQSNSARRRSRNAPIDPENLADTAKSRSTVQQSNPAAHAIEEPTCGTVFQNEAAQDRARRDSTASKLPTTPPMVPAGYTIIRQLGRGTFGEVWLGVQEKSQVQVAIKFFYSRGADQWQLLTEEAKKLAMLHSDPRIVRLIEVDADSPVPFFVMDFAENGSLKSRLAKGKLPIAEAVRIFREIVEAMAYVHAKGIRHCDLKPGNILLDAAGRPRIADFGQSHLSIEPTASALGTFFYMAPEQASHDKQVPDTRWDVFGLGALLFAMITGQPPRYDRKFKEELENTQEMPHRLRRYRDWLRTAPSPKEHRRQKGMDRHLEDLIDRCLDVDPERRLRDAGDVLASLDQRERRRRMRPLLIFAVLAPLLLMAAAGLFGFLMVQTSIKQAEKSLVNHLLQSDQVTANLVANVIREKLSEAGEEMRKLANSERLSPLLQDYLKEADYLVYRTDPKQRPLVQDPSIKSLKNLEGHLEKVGNFVNARFNSVSVFDAEGNILAFYLSSRKKFDRNIYGRNYSYRDYFNRDGDKYGKENQQHPYLENWVDGPEGRIDAPYIGQPYVSTAVSNFMAITVSVPIYEDPKTGRNRIGLLLGTIELDKLNSWLDPIEAKGGMAVLFDRRGYCLYHKEGYRKDILPKSDQAPPKLAFQSPTYQHAVQSGETQLERHIDPIDRKIYLAAVTPDSVYGFGVVVQHDRQEALAEIKDVRDDLMRYIWVVGGFSGLILSAFWGWLLWLLMKKERIAHA